MLDVLLKIKTDVVAATCDDRTAWSRSRSMAKKRNSWLSVTIPLALYYTSLGSLEDLGEHGELLCLPFKASLGTRQPG